MIEGVETDCMEIGYVLRVVNYGQSGCWYRNRGEIQRAKLCITKYLAKKLKNLKIGTAQHSLVKLN